MATIACMLILLVLLTPPLGSYLHRVYDEPRIGRVEAVIYRLIGVSPMAEQSWRRYASSALWFSLAGMGVLYVLLRIQEHLGLNPERLPGVNPYVAFNTAASFVTNTNWQAYAGEGTMSYLTQMVGLTVQNFVSAAVGMAVLIAMIRGFVRTNTDRVGNFWRDLVRGVVYVLLPLSALLAVILAWQGVVQTLGPYRSVTGIQGFRQLIAVGPAASQIAIKQLGTNGGGFFNANSAHPFENPTPLTNLLECLSIVLIPAALTYTFGKMIGNTREGWALFTAMFILFLAGLAITFPAERGATAAMRSAGIPATAPNLEGKEVRIGADASSLWAVTTTAASNGSVNAMHSSFAPPSGAVQLFNMAIGEVVFGGVGSGLYGMLFYAILAVFIGDSWWAGRPSTWGRRSEPERSSSRSSGSWLPSCSCSA